MFMRILLVAGLTIWSGVASAATFQTFTDRSTFEGAAGPVGIETLNSAAGGASFADTPLTVGDLTLQTTGTTVQGGDRNAIDAPPFIQANFNIDGTNNATVFIDGDDIFTIQFANLTRAFGSDFGELNDPTSSGGHRTELYILNQTIPLPLGNGGTSFFGVISDTYFDTVSFTLVGAGDGFSIDNITTAVPILPTLPLLLGALAVVAAVGRRADVTA